MALRLRNVHLVANVFLIAGKDCCLNSSGASVLSSHKPQSSATKNLIHFAQSKGSSICAMQKPILNKQNGSNDSLN